MLAQTHKAFPALLLLAAMTAACEPEQPSQSQPPATQPAQGVTVVAQPDAQIVGFGGARPDLTIPAQLAKLKPDDRLVEVRRGLVTTPPTSAVPEDLDGVIQAFTPIADAVAVVRVVNRSSRLNERRDWLESTVTCQVVSVLNDPDSRLTVGKMVSFEEQGGSIVIDGRQVFTADPYALPMQTGREYFLFLLARPDGTWANLAGAAGTFEIRDGRVAQRLRPDVKVTGATTTQEVEANVRSAGLLPRVKRRGRP